MNSRLEKNLIKKYPAIFRDMSGDRTKTCMHYGIACGDGWFFILDDLCQKIQSRIDQRADNILKGFIKDEAPLEQVVAVQIKEKFGALRFYYDGGDPYIQACVDMVEHLSMGICENCGTFDDSIGRTKGWIKSLCPLCSKKKKRSIVQRKSLIALWDKVRADKLKSKE